MVSEIQPILDRVREYLPTANLTRIEEAYVFAKAAHEGQLRFSGEPYIVHPVAATERLLALQPDEDAIVACLLHDVVEDTDVDLETIKKKFGPVVANLCAGLEKLGKVRYQGEDRQIENLRKMLVAMAADLRVIFIKLADRMHNMETLEHVRPEKQRRIAKETLEIYAPIAARLGLYDFKKKLEDLAFLRLDPDEYARIRHAVAGTESSRKKFIESAQSELKRVLAEAGITAEVTGRTKHYYSIWKKLSEKQYTSVDEIYDLFALRVIVEKNEECYTALGVIHRHFTPLSQRFKDFIAVPKINGYQSLHTTVLGLDATRSGMLTEIQIRTRAMHAEAERGAAAHWEYAEHKHSTVMDESKLKWVKSLVDLHDRLKDNHEFVETLAVDAFADRIFTLTPRGDVIDLPAGATPIDFAYNIHTEVGNRAIAAKVNGRIAPLDSQLKNGDVLEIVTRKDAKPNRFWLSFAKSESARNKIKAYFNALDRTENVTAGKELLNKQLARLGKNPLDSNYSILKTYKGRELDMKEREGVLEMIGNGSVQTGAVVRNLFEGEFIPPAKKKAAREIEIAPSEILIAGERGLAYSLGKCCDPKEGQQIIALMSRKGATIHRDDCKMLARANPERRLTATWGAEPPAYVVDIALAGNDRVGLLRDIATTISELSLNITDLTFKIRDGQTVRYQISMEVPGLMQLTKVLETLEAIPSVTSVTRLPSPASPDAI